MRESGIPEKPVVSNTTRHETIINILCIQSNMKNTKIWNYLWFLDIFNWFIKTLVVYVEMHTFLNKLRIELSIFLISYSVD
jgi:hypothetical protein